MLTPMLLAEALRQGKIKSGDKLVLAGFGNMSSATVLFVIEHFLRSSDYRKGDRVLSTALGPGFFSEMVLARCL